MKVRERPILTMFCTIFLAAALAFFLMDPYLYMIVAIHLFAIPALAYPLVYRKSPWRYGTTGRALMNKARAVALLFFITIVGHWWPFNGYHYMYAIVVTYLGCAITYQLWVMMKLRHSAHPRSQP